MNGLNKLRIKQKKIRKMATVCPFYSWDAEGVTSCTAYT